jgi:hypothetical protein
MKNSIFKWELTGIAVIFLIGAAFHFTFDWLGSHPAAAAFFPVNESIFEHLKMTFWPTLIWAVFSYNFLKSKANNFFTAKAAAVIIMPLVIVILYYAYTAFTDENTIVDIIIFLIAVGVGQVINALIMAARPLAGYWPAVSAVIILLLALLYAFFTFYPPYTSFFIDTNTDSYGIPQNLP